MITDITIYVGTYKYIVFDKILLHIINPINTIIFLRLRIILRLAVISEIYSNRYGSLRFPLIVRIVTDGIADYTISLRRRGGRGRGGGNRSASQAKNRVV